jgi:hypothetical protein
MVLNINVIAIMIPSIIIFASCIMSHSESIGSLVVWSLFLMASLVPHLFSLMSIDLQPKPINLGVGTTSSPNDLIEK